MKRKLIKLGPNTLLVSIPNALVEKYAFKKGDEVDIEENNSQIVLKTGKPEEKEKKTYSADVGSFTETANRYIVTLYRLGYSEYDIIYSDPEYIKTIPKILSDNTIGLAIIEQRKNSCRIKDLSENSENQLEPILKRMWYLILTMAEDIEKAIKENSYAELSNMYYREKSINQFMNYCLRLISTHPEAAGQPFSLYFFIRNLESISDAYRDLAMLYAERKAKSTEIASHVDNATRVLRLLFDCFYSFSNEKLEEIILESKKQEKDIYEKLSQGKGEAAAFLMHVHSILQKIRELCSPEIELHIARSRQNQLPP